VVEELSNDNFAMKIDNLLFSILLNEPGPTKWKIEPQSHHGDNTYLYVRLCMNTKNKCSSFYTASWRSGLAVGGLSPVKRSKHKYVLY
jgi:hypothetical protein